jgi:hypothetical protein
MLNFTCNYWQESCTLARLWICHLFVNSTQKIQTEINKRAWLAPDIRTLGPSGCMCLPRLLYPPRMPDKSDCHHLPRLSCMRLQLCACPPTPYGAARTHASPCLMLRISLHSMLRAHACRCRWGPPILVPPILLHPSLRFCATHR